MVINSACDFHNSQINILDAQAINFVKTIKHSQKWKGEEEVEPVRQFLCSDALVKVVYIESEREIEREGEKMQEGRKGTRIVIYDSWNIFRFDHSSNV